MQIKIPDQTRAEAPRMFRLTYMSGCQNYGPLLGTLNIRCRIIIGIQKGTIILTTTHMKEYKNKKKASIGFQLQNLRISGFEGLGLILGWNGPKP